MYLTTFENLVMWCIGYGGWMGIGVAPLVVILTGSNKTRLILALLCPPLGAILMTTVFSLFYLYAAFVHSMLTIMISPALLHSMTSCVSLSITTFAGTFILFDLLNNKMPLKAKEEDVGSEEGDVGSEEEDVGSEEEDVGSEEEDVGSEEEDVGSEEGNEEEELVTEIDAESQTDDEINLEPLRNAPPLPDVDEA